VQTCALPISRLRRRHRLAVWAEAASATDVFRTTNFGGAWRRAPQQLVRPPVANILQKNWQDLIKPTKLNVQPGRERDRFATLVAEPLERGFGMTLGNALRRVLLSSLQGAAVRTVQIDGVLHEFSSIPGIREDVTDIILNIEEIALKVHSEGIKRMVLRKEGPGPARAADIEASSEVEILNPDHVICHLDEGASVRMEFTADMGKGYVPAERNRPEDAPIGLIPVDSLYSPVKKV